MKNNANTWSLFLPALLLLTLSLTSTSCTVAGAIETIIPSIPSTKEICATPTPDVVAVKISMELASKNKQGNTENNKPIESTEEIRSCADAVKWLTATTQHYLSSGEEVASDCNEPGDVCIISKDICLANYAEVIDAKAYVGHYCEVQS